MSSPKMHGYDLVADAVGKGLWLGILMAVAVHLVLNCWNASSFENAPSTERSEPHVLELSELAKLCCFATH